MCLTNQCCYIQNLYPGNLNQEISRDVLIILGKIGYVEAIKISLFSLKIEFQPQ